jgi:hypothetical protein
MTSTRMPASSEIRGVRLRWMFKMKDSGEA